MVAERFLVLALVGAGLALVWLGLRWRSARYRRPDARDVLTHLAVPDDAASGVGGTAAPLSGAV